MGEVILLVQEVNIVRADQSRADFFRQFRQFRVHGILLGDVLLNFDEKPLGPENIEVGFRDRLGRFHVPLHECRGHFTAQARARGDQPFAVLSQNFLVDSRLVIEALFIRQAAQLFKIVIPFEILGEQQQVIRRLAMRGRSIAPVTGGHVGLHAEDRLDPLFFALVEKLDDPEHATMIRDGQRIHP